MESGPGLESAQRQSKTSLWLQRDGVTSGKSWTLIGRTVVLALGRAAVTGAAVVVVVVLVARAAAVRLVARAVAAVTAVARPRRHQQAAWPARTLRQSETKGVSAVHRRVVPGNWCLYKFCPPCNEGFARSHARVVAPSTYRTRRCLARGSVSATMSSSAGAPPGTWVASAGWRCTRFLKNGPVNREDVEFRNEACVAGCAVARRTCGRKTGVGGSERASGCVNKEGKVTPTRPQNTCR